MLLYNMVNISKSGLIKKEIDSGFIIRKFGVLTHKMGFKYYSIR